MPRNHSIKSRSSFASVVGEVFVKRIGRRVTASSTPHSCVDSYSIGPFIEREKVWLANHRKERVEDSPTDPGRRQRAGAISELVSNVHRFAGSSLLPDSSSFPTDFHSRFFFVFVADGDVNDWRRRLMGRQILERRRILERWRRSPTPWIAVAVDRRRNGSPTQWIVEVGNRRDRSGREKIELAP